MKKLEASERQKAFLNEAKHLGLETSLIILPKEVVLIIKEPSDIYPDEIRISALEGKQGHVHEARLADWNNYSKRITLTAAGLKMLEWKESK